MGKNKQSSRSVCFHEAGHAVIRLVQGLGVVSVNVIPDPDRLTAGCCFSPIFDKYIWSPSEKRKLIRADIISTFAGIEAERLYDPEASEWKARGDFRRAFLDSLESYVLPNRYTYKSHIRILDRLRKVTRSLVEHYRDDIEALAELLKEKRELTCREIFKAFPHLKSAMQKQRESKGWNLLWASDTHLVRQSQKSTLSSK